MAKKHKNAQKFPIQWNGIVVGGENQGDSIPTSVELKWAGEYIPCWSNSYNDCVLEDMLYFEDFDICAGVGDYTPNDNINIVDVVCWGDVGESEIQAYVGDIVTGANPTPDKAPKSAYNGYLPYTWGDVNFLQEVVDGIGTGSRRAREARLNKFDKDKKKRLIRLICRVKGEKVYDEEKEVGDSYIKLEDAELVINEVLGKIKVEKADVL
jgi:hypothetical protein